MKQAMKSQMNTDKHGYYNVLLTFIGVNLWLVALLASNSLAQTYTNPVIAGDFPDPSVIRVGHDYYAATTTGGWSPHFPILHSRDLVNWKIIGSVFEQKPAWIKSDFWAPELINDKGRFFVYYAARRNDGAGKKGTLCIAVATADKPDGKWQDHGALVCQEMGSIDPFFVRDENGKPFLVWKEDGNDRGQPTWIYAQGLDKSGTKLVGEPTKLFRNTEPWERHVIEGSFILRRNGWFYHFYSGSACCGRECDYALGVARSKTLLGKWEKYGKNPILAANETWQCPGHGSIVETPDGSDYLLYHAYRKRPDAFNVGREALLDKIEWTADGWAQINGGRGPSKTARLPFLNFKQKLTGTIDDEFNDLIVKPTWQYPLFNKQTFLVGDGFLKIAPTEKQFAAEKFSELVLAERTISGSYTATTRIDVSNLQAEEFAGLAAYSWRFQAVGASVGNNKIFVWRRENGKQTEVSAAELPKNAAAIWLKMRVRDGAIYNFEFSADGTRYSKIGEPAVTANVEGARVALLYNGKTAAPSARFDWLRIISTKSEE